MKYIIFCEMTNEFLKLPIEERQAILPHWSQIAQKYGLKMLFWGMPIGVTEHIVIVFETNENEKYFMFQREWLALGTEDVGKYVKNTRTITVY